MPEQIVLFGLNHRTAPVELREKWAFSSDEAVNALRGARDSFGDVEGLILSTCNRTEVYARLPDGFLSSASNDPKAPQPNSKGNAGLRRFMEYYYESKACPGTTFEPHVYVHHHRDAVSHLFRLAGGLDSMVLGEGQILRQIRDAFELAQEAGAVGRVFHRLFPAAMRTGRRVRHDTALGEGCITAGQAAVRIAERELGDLSDSRFLILGSGEIATLTAMAFREKSLKNFYVMNRSRERADDLVSRLGGEARSLDELQGRLSEVDVVITSTSSKEPVIRADALGELMEKRDGRPLLFIDLAVPRDVESEVASLPNVHLYNIDNLEEVIAENIAGRRSEIPRAESIIKSELRSFFSQMNWVHLDPVIRHLRDRFESLRDAELENVLQSVPSEYHARIERFAENFMKKVIHFPIEKLKSLRDGDGLNPTEIAFLKRLFLANEQFDSRPPAPPSEAETGDTR